MGGAIARGKVLRVAATLTPALSLKGDLCKTPHVLECAAAS